MIVFITWVSFDSVDMCWWCWCWNLSSLPSLVSSPYFVSWLQSLGLIRMGHSLAFDIPSMYNFWCTWYYGSKLCCRSWVSLNALLLHWGKPPMNYGWHSVWFLRTISAAWDLNKGSHTGSYLIKTPARMPLIPLIPFPDFFAHSDFHHHGVLHNHDEEQ